MNFSLNMLSGIRADDSLPKIILILSNVFCSRNSGDEFKVVI